jgi:pimeloyl-ACP methyl ester carboxylesterase
MISDMSIEGRGEALHAIIHHENINTCVMIGHSMGGYITLAFAEKYWNHLHAFGLIHSSAFADSEEKKATRNKGIDFIDQHGAFEFLKAIIPNLFSRNTKNESPELVNDFINTQSGSSPASLIAYYRAMIQRPDRTSVLINAKVPVLFIAGEHDAAIPFEDSLKQSHLSEKYFFHILKKSGHMGMLEETQKMNRIIKDFLVETNKENGQ